MPYKKRAPVKRKRPTRGKKFVKRTNRKSSMPMTIRNSDVNELIAARYITCLKYCDRGFVSTATNGVTQCYLYNLNSIYDPDRTGVGHQPLGRDQLSLIYNRYRVFACSWRISFYAASQPALITIIPQNNAGSLNATNPSQLKEQPHAFSKLTRLDVPTIFTGKCNLPRLAGQTSAQFKGGLEFQSGFGSDPSELQTLAICVNPLVTNALNWNYEIELKYYVECFDPLPLLQS